MKRTSAAKGFTLVEILVVLGIVTVLAAILFTVFIRVRENGRSATCQNNLRQIALAMQQYVQDSDGRYPIIDYYQTKLLPYLKNPQVFQCPSEPTPQGNNPRVAQFDDYALHADAISTVFEPVIVGRHEAVLVKPATTILIFDHDFNSAHCTEVDGVCGYVGCMPARHSGGANYGFLDGHVKWLNPESAYGVWCSNKTTP